MPTPQQKTQYTVEDAPAPPAPQYSVEDAPVAPPEPGMLDRLAAWGHKIAPHLSPQDMQSPEMQQNDAVRAHPSATRFLANTGSAALNAITSAPAAVADWVSNNAWTPKQSAQQMADRSSQGTPYDPNKHVTGADVSDYASEHLGSAMGGVLMGEAGGAALGAAGKVASKGKSILTGGTKAAADLSKATMDANEASSADAATKNAKIQSKRTQELNDHFQAIQDAKGAEPTTVGALPDSDATARPRNAKELQSHKEALQRGVQQLDQQFKSDITNTAKDAKTQLDNKYDTVRSALDAKTDPATGEITPAPTIPSPDLAKAVNNAEAKLMGSSENIKQFRDILSKHPENDPDFVTYQGAQIPRGHPLYDVIQEHSPNAPSGATFKDLQGYYTELGDKLSSGGLQGDVYQAMKALHDDIGGMMQKMAEENGVGDKLADAQNYARNYYADWRDPASPLYKAIKKAPERGDSISHFQGADQSGIATLAKYNPELAKRANTIRAYQQQAASIPNKPFVEKPVSALGPSPTLMQPEVKTVGTSDIQAANAAELMKRTAAIRKTVNKAAVYVTGIRSLSVIGRALSGDASALAALPADIGEGMALAAGGNGLATFLESPKVAEYLTKPTPAQVATIDPAIARDLAPIVNAAKKQGIRISPAITAAISAHATKNQWWDRPSQ
jgi:hypothetical protein